MGTGVTVKPEHWDVEAQQVRTVRGTPHASVNPRLNRAHEAAQDALQQAHRQGRQLPKAELKAALDAALALAPAALAPAAGGDEPAAEDFFSLLRRWIPEHSLRPRANSGRPLSKTAVAGLEATAARLRQYAEARGGAELTLAGMSTAFY